MIPRIERLEVSNFQSLVNADIELGALTVIVGPSNSGKSALLRALKAVVRNVNSPSAVRAGQSMFTSQIEFSGRKVALERGKSHSTYKVIESSGEEDVFTKAGRAVPEEVQQILGLPGPDGPDLVFSSQIDPPFLLSETGSVAAKMLGDLTNVSRLHGAAKEANRRRLEASKVHTIRVADVRGCYERMQSEFSDLHATKATLADARALLESVRQSAREVEILENELHDLEMVEAAERSLLSDLSHLPQPADIEKQAEEAGRLLAERHLLLDALSVLSKLSEEQDSLQSQFENGLHEMERLEQEFQRTLAEAGTCPTCGKAVA